MNVFGRTAAETSEFSLEKRLGVCGYVAGGAGDKTKDLCSLKDLCQRENKPGSYCSRG